MGNDKKKTPADKPVVKPQILKIVLRRSMKVGTVNREAGETIAQVTPAPGCSLNFLGRALVDSIASEKVKPVAKS